MSADAACYGELTRHVSSLEQGSPGGVYVIGIAGGSGSGKSTLSNIIKEGLNGTCSAEIIDQRSFYCKVPAGVEITEHNFDHPDAFDEALMVSTIKRLKAGHCVDLEVYSEISSEGRGQHQV